MKDIGGYFELEVSKGGSEYHSASYRLKSGRSALHLMLNSIKPKVVYVPYYTCDSLLEPFAISGCRYEFYAINEQLEPVSLPVLNDNEYFLYINYFGLKDGFTEMLSGKYGAQLIVDATQAFFMKGKGVSWLFNSCRKFFGVPDGSYIYTPLGTTLQPPREKNEHYITSHLTKRLNGQAKEGYADFQANESMIDCSITAMSEFTTQILSEIDNTYVINKRRANYNFLSDKLSDCNKLHLPETAGMVPMIYPFLPTHEIIKALLAENQIYIPTFWKEVLERNHTRYEFEKSLAAGLLPLPVDHRYTIEDMELLVSFVTKFQG